MRPRPPGALSFRRCVLRHSFAAGGLWAWLLLLVLLGCGRSTASQDDAAADPPLGPTISIPLAARLKSVPTCNTDLLARVIVDGNESNPIGLFVDCTAGTVSGTISGLSPGSHTFELHFSLIVGTPQTSFYEVLIATALTTGNISSGQDTPIAFAPGSLVFPDHDHDGWTNLAEIIAFCTKEVSGLVCAGTQYLSASISPDSSARRKSARYSVADSLGATPAVGVASSGGYTASSAGAAPAIGTASGGRYTDSSGRVPSNR